MKFAWPIIVAVVTAVAILWWFRVRTYHFAEVDPGKLYRDGNRGTGEYANMLRKSHAKTVVALVDDAEIADPEKPEFQDGFAILTQHKIQLKRVPIPLGGWPTKENIEGFLAIATDRANCPVLVHCAQGVRRTGMMVAAYQMSVLEWDKEKTKAAILAFGHSERSIGDVKKFIELYDPQTKAMRETPERSKE